MAGIVGYVCSASLSKNVWNIGNVTGTSLVGGIAGKIETEAKVTDESGVTYKYGGNCSSSVPLTGTYGQYEYYYASIEMPSLLSVIGNNFKSDVDNINNGYPILDWEK